MASADDIKITVDLSHTPPVERLLREHSELLAALGRLVDQDEACEKSLCLEYGKPWEEPGFAPSPALAEARALITRIEKP